MSGLNTFFSPFHNRLVRSPSYHEAGENNFNDNEESMDANMVGVVGASKYHESISNFNWRPLHATTTSTTSHQGNQSNRAHLFQQRLNELLYYIKRRYYNYHDTRFHGQLQHERTPVTSRTTDRSRSSTTPGSAATYDGAQSHEETQSTFEGGGESQLQFDTQQSSPQHFATSQNQDESASIGKLSHVDDIDMEEAFDTQPPDDAMYPSRGANINSTPSSTQRKTGDYDSDYSVGRGESDCNVHEHVTSASKKRHREMKAPSIWIEDATFVHNSLSELNLSTASFSISLSRVRLVWDLHPTGNYFKDDDKNDPYETYHRDGPLSPSYDVVLSMEILEIGLDDSFDDITGSSTISSTTDSQQRFVRESAQRAFYNGRSEGVNTLEAFERREAMKKLKKTKRIKIYFYNKYARIIHSYLQSANLHRAISNNSVKTSWMDILLLSIRNCPAGSIFPFQPPVELSSTITSSSSNAIEDILVSSRYGELSPWCICIGDKSDIKANMFISGHNHSTSMMHFDNNVDEISPWTVRLFHMPDNRKLDSFDMSSSNGDGIVMKQVVMSKNVVKVEDIICCKRHQDHSNDVTVGSASSSTEKVVTEFLSKIHKSRSNALSLYRGNQGIGRTMNVTRTTVQMPSPTYQKLADLIQIAQHNKTVRWNKATLVDVYAVVLSVKPPMQTRGKDWSMKLSLIDDSLPLLDPLTTEDGDTSHHTENNRPSATSLKVPSSIILNIFLRDEKRFPNVLRAGDVIRAHRVEPKIYNDQFNLVGRNVSSFVVCRPHDRVMEKMYRTRESEWSSILSAEESNWDIHHRGTSSLNSSLSFNTIKEVWLWGMARLAHHPTVNDRFAKCLADIAQVGRSDYSDWVVMISAIIRGSTERASSSPRGYLRVWDGTGPPECDPFCSSFNEDVKRKGEPSMEGILSLSAAVDSINVVNDFGESDSVKKPKSVCGRIANVVIWEDKHWESIIHSRFATVGGFICFRNASVRKCFRDEKWVCDLVLDKSASLTPLPSTTFEVTTLLRQHNIRIANDDTFNPNSKCLPLQIPSAKNDYDGTAMFLKEWKRLSHPPAIDHYHSLIECMISLPPSKFPTIFRVQKIFSKSQTITGSQQTISWKDLCFDINGKKAFQFVLLIHDMDVDLKVIVKNSVAEMILGIQAERLHSELEVDGNMQRSLRQKLLDLMKGLKSGIIECFIQNGMKYFSLESVQSISD